MYLLDGVAERWKRQYNNALNTIPLNQQLQSSISLATPRKKKKTLSTNEKYKVAHATALEMVTLMAEQGMDDFNKKHAQLKPLLATWKEGTDSEVGDIPIEVSIEENFVEEIEEAPVDNTQKIPCKKMMHKMKTQKKMPCTKTHQTWMEFHYHILPKREEGPKNQIKVLLVCPGRDSRPVCHRN